MSFGIQFRKIHLLERAPTFEMTCVLNMNNLMLRASQKMFSLHLYSRLATRFEHVSYPLYSNDF